MFPGGCAHACELETSLYLYRGRRERPQGQNSRAAVISFHEDQSPFNWVDLFAAGPATVISWTSSYSDTGVLGEAVAGNEGERGTGVSRGGEAVVQLRELFPPCRPKMCGRNGTANADNPDAVEAAARRENRA